MERVARWFADAEAKLDEWGRPAWIATLVIAFILVWPIGLALLFYMIWSGRMNCSRKRSSWFKGSKPTGNVAFDEYREETLKRLEDEQSAFEGFLGNLRRAKDKAELDQFMDERRRRGPIDGEPEPA